MFCTVLRFIFVTFGNSVINNNIPFVFQVGVKGKDVVVLCVEKKSVPQLQEERTVRKICILDDHVLMAFAGECCQKCIVNMMCMLMV